MPHAHILTPRLILVGFTTALMQAEAACTTRLARLLGADIPQCWPPQHWEPHVLDFIQKQHAEAPQTCGWHRYVLLRAEKPTLIGTMGAHPRSATEAEIGYSLLEPWQGAGLATEGVGALVTELFRDHSLKAISAQTFPRLAASIRVLEKCGFQPAGAGDEEGTVRFRLDRAERPP